ncbi:MAG: carboxypeptidase regulatory-like domain-containing protein [Terriglobales bacterium]
MGLRLLGLALFSATVMAQAAPGRAKPAEYRIAGVVYDATSGQTLPGARISLGSTAANKVPDRSVLSGPDGSFAFEHLAADKYQMYGEAVGYPLQGFEEHESPYLTGVVVGPDISSDHLVFRLQRGSMISGTVTDEYNDPVRDAQVTLFRRGLENGRFSTHTVDQGQTDDRGVYKFAPLLPGTYFVAVTAKPWYSHSTSDMLPQATAMASPQVVDSMKQLDLAYPLTFYSGTTDANNATEIKLRNGDRTTADIVLHAVPAARVRVRIPARAEGRYFPSIRLAREVFGEELVTQYEQRGSENEMVFAGTAPGHYLVHVRVPGSEGDRAQEVDVNGETIIDADTISGSGSSSIKGLVRMSDGQAPPPNVVILLRSQSGLPSAGARVHDKGEFSFDQVQPGTYEIGIVNSQNVYLMDMAVSNAKVNGRSVTVSAGASAQIGMTLGRGMGEIKGIALRDGKGAGGTLVLLVPGNPAANYGLFRRDQSDSDGTFTLAQIVPGRYSIVSIQDGWDLEWSKPEVLKPYLAKAETIEVSAGGRYQLKVQVQRK